MIVVHFPGLRYPTESVRFDLAEATVVRAACSRGTWAFVKQGPLGPKRTGNDFAAPVRTMGDLS